MSLISCDTMNLQTMRGCRENAQPRCIPVARRLDMNKYTEESHVYIPQMLK